MPDDRARGHDCLGRSPRRPPGGPTSAGSTAPRTLSAHDGSALRVPPARRRPRSDCSAGTAGHTGRRRAAAVVEPPSGRVARSGCCPATSCSPSHLRHDDGDHHACNRRRWSRRARRDRGGAHVRQRRYRHDLARRGGMHRLARPGRCQLARRAGGAVVEHRAPGTRTSTTRTSTTRTSTTRTATTRTATTRKWRDSCSISSSVTG